jgi:hypothetical protein
VESATLTRERAAGSLEVVLGLYRGRSLLSRMIQCRTWSPWSHASLVLLPAAFWSASAADREVYLLHAAMIDAWKGGVRRVDGLLAGRHDRRTEVTLLRLRPEYASAFDALAAWRFACDQVGAGYDYLGVLGFVARRDVWQRPAKWFCSELAAAAFARGGVDLLAPTRPFHRIAPGDIAASPRLVAAYRAGRGKESR